MLVYMNEFQGRKCTNIFGDYTDLLYRLHRYVIWLDRFMQLC